MIGLAVVIPAPENGRAADLSGTWTGSWKSCTTGHAGPLSASFMPCGTTEYRVTFTGRFLKVIPFRYTVALTVVEERDDEVVLAGSSYLGRLFGTFAYRAAANGERFSATYLSPKDQGEFRMTRSSR